PPFSLLPPEILLHILKRECLREIVDFGQTSRRLYSLVKNERIVWKNAKDAEYLPLPTGHTIHTVPVELLFPIALRACSIAIALQQPIVIPKRFAPVAPLNIERDEMPYNLEIPGGRWTMYNTESGIRFYDSSETPLENDTIISDGRLARSAIGTVGGGIVRCLQAICTDSNPPYVPLGSSYVIDIQFAVENTENCSANQAPQINSVPIPIPRINGPDVSDIMGSLILSIGEQSYDFLYLCNVESRTGLILRFTGHNKSWYQIKCAQFLPSLRKVLLNIQLPENHGGYDYDFAVWVFDIPEVPSPNASESSTTSEFLWMDQMLHIQSDHQYIEPLDWDGDNPDPSEMPDSYVGVDEFILRCPQFPEAFAMSVVCLTPEDKLEAVFLGLFDRAPEYCPYGGRIIGTRSVSENRLHVVCTDPLRRKLLEKTFEIPGGADLEGESMITRVDLVHGQVALLRRKGRGVLDTVPCFVLQY
ncbi:hypothetical protein SISNIDRAFT_461550, partial [Sistotremastrum niveocremeum HHB9708]